MTVTEIAKTLEDAEWNLYHRLKDVGFKWGHGKYIFSTITFSDIPPDERIDAAALDILVDEGFWSINLKHADGWVTEYRPHIRDGLRKHPARGIIDKRELGGVYASFDNLRNDYVLEPWDRNDLSNRHVRPELKMPEAKH